MQGLCSSHTPGRKNGPYLVPAFEENEATILKGTGGSARHVQPPVCSRIEARFSPKVGTRYGLVSSLVACSRMRFF